MDQLPLFQSSQAPFTVSEVNAHIRDLMEADEVLQDLWVHGEISNLSRPKSGHLYFSIKDGNATLRVVMWRNSTARLIYQPQDGDQIEAHGNISVYEVGGQYQLYADQIRPAGLGSLFLEFQKLKEKLEKEGLFDQERKRAIPSLPKVIGVVTSPSGAALRDILNTIRRRYPLVEVIVSPATVQGESAPKEIISAINQLNQYTKPDLIILARGGGSIEDLWAFNDEAVAHAIADSDAPLISGVGHETDFTIADFVSDLRAPTPTAAAELATPNRGDILANLGELQEILYRTVSDFIQEARWGWKEIANRLLRQSPENRLLSDRQRLDELLSRGALVLGHNINLQKTKLAGIQQQLIALSPQNVLTRGFAMVTGQDGGIIKSKTQVKKGEEIDIRLSDGNLNAEVK